MQNLIQLSMVAVCGISGKLLVKLIHHAGEHGIILRNEIRVVCVLRILDDDLDLLSNSLGLAVDDIDEGIADILNDGLDTFTGVVVLALEVASALDSVVEDLDLGVNIINACLLHGFGEQLGLGVIGAPCFTLICLTIEDHSLGELGADPDDRVKAGQGVLEDHGDAVAADLVEILFANLHEVLTVINYFAAFGDCVACKDTHDSPCGN